MENEQKYKVYNTPEADKLLGKLGYIKQINYVPWLLKEKGIRKVNTVSYTKSDHEETITFEIGNRSFSKSFDYNVGSITLEEYDVITKWIQEVDW